MELSSVQALLILLASELLFLYCQDKTIEDTKPVIEALKSKGISAIGAVGFCWGGEFI